MVITPDIATSDLESYGTTVESLLIKKNKKYDLYFYYSAYSKRYGNYLLNLEDYLPEEYSKIFDEKILKKGCTSSDNKLIGLVTNIYKYYLIYIYNIYNYYFYYHYILLILLFQLHIELLLINIYFNIAYLYGYRCFIFKFKSFITIPKRSTKNMG